MVRNIPADLSCRDIETAFEQAVGTIVSCKLNKDMARITFLNSRAARKAVDIFDQGEMNGNIIEVSLHLC
eukprot:1776040-Alexandrium_andersonii.AAC.1